MSDLITAESRRNEIAAEITDIQDKLQEFEDFGAEEFSVNSAKQRLGQLEADAKQLDGQIAKLEEEARKPAVTNEQLKKLYPTTPTEHPAAEPSTSEPSEPAGIQSVYNMEQPPRPKRPEGMDRLMPDNELTPEQLTARERLPRGHLLEVEDGRAEGQRGGVHLGSRQNQGADREGSLWLNARRLTTSRPQPSWPRSAWGPTGRIASTGYASL